MLRQKTVSENMNDTPILQCQNLTKSYKGGRRVLNSLNLSLPSGRIFGLLGPNGCGKSTLIKCVAGLLVPDSGDILLDGKPRTEESNALLSYLPERTCYQSGMIVSDLIRYYEDFFPDFDSNLCRSMLADLEIKTYVRLRTLSKGTKEKLQLIFVMARRAKLYMLDEPIAGVDPAARDYILSAILKNYNQNSSILITTHLLSDIENVLDDFAFLGTNGTVLLSGSADEVRATYGKTLNSIFKEVFPCSANA